MCEKFLVQKDAEELKRRLAAKGQVAIETVITEILEGFSSNSNSGIDTVDYIMSMVVDEENNNVQSSPNNPGLSTMEIKSEMCHNTDEASDKSFESQSSSAGYISAEIIDIPSDSDDDRDYYYCNTPDMDDVSIIDTVKAEHTPTINHTIWKPVDLTNRLLNQMASTAASNDICSPLDLTNNKLLLNQIVTASTSSHEQIVSNEAQNGPKAKVVEENNNDVIYTKHVYKKKRSSKRPKPGCSKDVDDATPEIEDVCYFSNLDELLKDAKLIHALLPRFSYRLIYRLLCNNQFARNRIELTLWDLLPAERPSAQPSQYKRKCSDEVYFIKSKKGSHTVLQKAQINTKTSLEKKEQVCTTNEIIVADIESENKEKTEKLLTDENDKMKCDAPETATLNNTNNDINQQSATSMKKTKLDYTTDEPMQCVEDSNNINTVIQDSKKSKVVSKIKEWQSTKNSEVKNKSELFPDNKVPTSYIPTVTLQPAKLTLDSFTPTLSQRFERLYKPTISVLSPPKLNLIAGSSALPRTTNVLQIQPITPNISNLPCDSLRLLNTHTPSNDKETSRIKVGQIGDIFRPSSIGPEPLISKTLNVFTPPKNMEMEGIKLANIYPATLSAFYNRPSSSTSSTETAQNVLDHQKASSSKANYNLEQEGGSMSTSQIYNRGDEKQVTCVYTCAC